MNISVSAGSKWIDLALKILRYPWIIPLIGIGIGVSGYILEAHCGKDLFQRFGSIMVAFAVLVIFIHYHLRLYSDKQKGSSELLENIKKSPALMQKTLSELPTHTHNQVVRSWDELIQKSNEFDIQLKDSSKSLALGEVLVGITGTIIWGFGDLWI